MLIGDNNNGQIVISNINGTLLDTLNLGVTGQSFYDADIDPINQKIFFSHYWGIFKMNYDGSAFDTLVYEPTGSYSDGITVDAVGGYLYWAAMQEKKIYRSDLNGANITTLFNASGFVTDIDIDLSNNKIYFGQWFSSARGLFSIDLNGNNLDTIIQSGYDVHFIGLDRANSKIYFSDDALVKCRRINYDGTNDTLLYNFQAGGFFVDTTNSLLYTSDMINNNIVLSDLNGGNQNNLFPTSTLASPHGPLLFSLVTFSTINETACSIYTSPSGNYSWTTSNTYMDTIPNVAGADSIITINLTIIPFDLSVTQTGTLLTANEVGGTYLWLNCPGMTPINGATNNSYTATTNGDYAVIVTNNSCSDTSSCYTVSTVGIIENNFKNELLLYPNPTDGNFSVDLGQNYQTVSITITDLNGKLIQYHTYKKSQLLNIKLDGPVGIYLLNIESVNNKAVIRLIKE